MAAGGPAFVELPVAIIPPLKVEFTLVKEPAVVTSCKVEALITSVAKVAVPVTSPVTFPVTFPVTLPRTEPVRSPVTSPVKSPVTLPWRDAVIPVMSIWFSRATITSSEPLNVKSCIPLPSMIAFCTVDAVLAFCTLSTVRDVMVPLDWVRAIVASSIDAEVKAEGTVSISNSIVSPSNCVRVITLLAMLAVVIALAT